MSIEQKVFNILTKRGHSKDMAERMISKNIKFCLSGYDNPSPAFIANFVSEVS